MNRRTIVPPEEMRQHHYPGAIPVQPFSYANQQPVPPRKSIQHDTDVYAWCGKNSKAFSQIRSFQYRITHTRSFQMLEGWISDSEKSTSSGAQSVNKSTGKCLTFHCLVLSYYRIIVLWKGQCTIFTANNNRFPWLIFSSCSAEYEQSSFQCRCSIVASIAILSLSSRTICERCGCSHNQRNGWPSTK